MIKKLLICFIAATCLILSGGTGRADLLFADEFNNDVLNPNWQIKSINKVDFLLTKQPGKLYVVNDGPETSIENADAARLFVAAPKGDFTIETQVTYATGACGGYSGPTLFISFDSRDTIALSYSQGGIFGDKAQYFTNTETGSREGIQSKQPPVFLRIKKVSDNYIFEFRTDPNNNWEGQKQMIVKSNPINLGLMFPRGRCLSNTSYEASLGYFRLETIVADTEIKNPESRMENTEGTTELQYSRGRGGIEIFKNGQPLNLGGAAPMEMGGHLLVPLRPMLGAFGISISSAVGGAIIAEGANKKIELQMGSNRALVDGQPVTMALTPQLILGQTMVPLTFIARAFNAKLSPKFASASVRFFNSGYDAPVHEKRVYQREFERSKADYISWELNLTHPSWSKNTPLSFDAIYYREDGTVLGRQTKNSYIQAGWDNSWHNLGLHVNGGGWVAGNYRVEIYMGKEKIAEGSFSVR